MMRLQFRNQGVALEMGEPLFSEWENHKEKYG
jgi:hypothetical protein